MLFLSSQKGPYLNERVKFYSQGWEGCGSTAKTKLYLPIKKFGTYEMLVIVLHYIIKKI